MSLDLTLMIFDHVGGAERAYADVLGASAASPWVHEIAFVEHHRHDRSWSAARSPAATWMWTTTAT